MSELDEATLVELEVVAVELARLAAAEIQTALGRELAIRYKGAAERQGPGRYRDPASEADERIERLIRDRLAELFPEHGVVGEEMATVVGESDAPIWVIDPIDGTANFVNGLPLFAASIGIMHRGVPVVGAVWCSTSHELRHGVYHAHRGGPLRFDESPMTLRAHADLRRHLAGEPDPTVGEGLHWEVRKTGSASIECAFVAAGLLRVARFDAPHLWDVAAGIACAQAAGHQVHEFVDGAWRPLEAVAATAIPSWRRPVIIGEGDAVEMLIQARSAQPLRS
ncbi:MAG: inositol monophosphatase family protein [Pseudomonadales bacterium]